MMCHFFVSSCYSKCKFELAVVIGVWRNYHREKNGFKEEKNGFIHNGYETDKLTQSPLRPIATRKSRENNTEYRY